MIKEIILFGYGDSRNASTWSNVPYLMSDEMERQGVTVRRVDLSGPRHLSKICDKLIRIWLKLSGSTNRDYRFIRTGLFRRLTYRKIAKALREWPEADFCLFLCMDFYNRQPGIPSMVFSDWTYEMLKERNGDKPDIYDRKFIKAQNKVLANAELVLPLFSTTYNRLKSMDGVKAIYPGFNVVNDMSRKKWTEDEILMRKEASGNLLFIGGRHYAAGLRLLIKAMEKADSGYTLHVIGMTPQDVEGVNTGNVVFHGYLHKDVAEENEKYYNLLVDARVLINPTPLWGAYSSVIEGMYYYTPIVISPYEQFVEEFGSDIDFGSYTTGDDIEDMAQCINGILNIPPEQYRGLCMRAHGRVKGYTWDKYVKFILDNMQERRDKI